MKRISNLPPKRELDRCSYNRLAQRLNDEKQQLAEIRSQIKAIRNNDGSNLAESPSFLFLVAQENGKIAEIESLALELENSVIVEKDKNNDLIDLGDCVTLEITYPDEEPIIKKYVLVGSSPDSFKNEISQGGAIGKAIKGKPAGATVKAVLPSGAIASIKIISKE